jgi:hypothetical protein
MNKGHFAKAATQFENIASLCSSPLLFTQSQQPPRISEAWISFANKAREVQTWLERAQFAAQLLEEQQEEKAQSHSSTSWQDLQSAIEQALSSFPQNTFLLQKLEVIKLHRRLHELQTGIQIKRVEEEIIHVCALSFIFFLCGYLGVWFSLLRVEY